MSNSLSLRRNVAVVVYRTQMHRQSFQLRTNLIYINVQYDRSINASMYAHRDCSGFFAVCGRRYYRTIKIDLRLHFRWQTNILNSFVCQPAQVRYFMHTKKKEEEEKQNTIEN